MLCIVLFVACCCTNTKNSIIPVPFNEVELTDGFWKERTQTILDSTIPFALGKCEPALERFRRTAKFRAGEDTPLPNPHRYISSDMYKVIEGASYSLMLRPDPELEKQLDYMIDMIGAAQDEDGYLYLNHIVGNANNKNMGDRRYGNVRQSHELYNVGHMYEAAVAYYLATGKDKLLNISKKNAQHVYDVFFVGGNPAYNDGKPVNQAPGHEEIELALCKMYRLTGDKFYLDMAKRFLDIRGVTYKPGGTGTMSDTYAQEHLPVAQQRTAEGHSVRAGYLYTAMAQVDALTGLNDYEEALESIWNDLVSTKMHIIGGLGAVRGIEGFGKPYELPNATAYDETCASVANVFFNQAMFLNTGDAKYLDIAELSLFNNALAGININGNRFFYVNPLERDNDRYVNKGRSEWFGTACCPPNITRLILQVPGYMFAYGDDRIYINLYGGSRATIPVKNSEVVVEQSSGYPFDGKVTVKIDPQKSKRFALYLRIPTWADGDMFVPGGLYEYENQDNETISLKVNGSDVEYDTEHGFAVIDRKWSAGDVVELELPMPVRIVDCDDRVEANIGRIALTRGPLVYCAEEVDNGGPVQRLSVAVDHPAPELQLVEEGILKGIEEIKVDGYATNGTIAPYRITLIPYYAWSNRGNGQSMIIWMPEKE